MKKTLRVVLEIDVSDLSREQRRACAEAGDCKESELPRLADHTPDEIAEVVAGIGADDMAGEMFGGTEVYARFTDARVVEAKWVEP